ncbi:Pentatricopeptide repeat-containing protein [Nymphaea thermarum]|nr:Pentatricopeptide repeat-containing protein [Nymphaea thermarum]
MTCFGGQGWSLIKVLIATNPEEPKASSWFKVVPPGMSLHSCGTGCVPFCRNSSLTLKSENPGHVSPFQFPTQSPSHSPDVQGCSSIHAQLITGGLHQNPIALQKIISFFAIASSGDMDHALLVFSQIEKPGIFPSSGPILGHLLIDMPSSFTSLNNYTFPLLINSCARCGTPESGMQVHSHIIKNGFDADLFVVNAMMHMYPVFGDIPNKQILNKITTFSYETKLYVFKCRKVVLATEQYLRGRLMTTGHAEQNTRVLFSKFLHQTLDSGHDGQDGRLSEGINTVFVLFCSELTLGTDRTKISFSRPRRPRALGVLLPELSTSAPISFSSTSASISPAFLLFSAPDLTFSSISALIYAPELPYSYFSPSPLPPELP